MNVENTDIHTTVTATEGTTQFDICAKRLMAHRSILGNVLARLLPPYRGMDPRRVAELILPDIYVSAVPVDHGRTNKAGSDDKNEIDENGDRIAGFNTEDQEINEGEIRFDLIFYARLPDGIARIIINIELQKERPTGYPLINRAIYYACREISSQKERDFKGRQYGRIKNTYSIWVCMNEAENSICDYHLTRDQIMGNTEWNANLDLLHVIMIGVTNDLPDKCEQNELHRLLCALYSNRMKRDNILNILEQEYNIPITEQLDTEVNDMCNLGEGIAERAAERAAQQTEERVTTQYVTSLFINHFDPDQIASGLNLSLDRVVAILTQQGLLPS